MSSFSSTPKPAYIYDESTDTWHPISAKLNAAANYTWIGAHSFSSSVVAKSGINNFQNPSSMAAAIPSPTNGVVSFVRQDNSGNILNSLQYYHNGNWIPVDDSLKLSSKTSSYTLQGSDGGFSIIFSGSTPATLTIPLASSVPFKIGQRIDIIRAGAGKVTVNGTAGVLINSKGNNRVIASQYSAATITKVGDNSWILVGDLAPF
jgi:hypothetical protein